MDPVGAAFLSAFLQVLFDRLASRDVVSFFTGRKHDDRLRTRLRDTLLTIDVVLDDAENKQYKNKAVKVWLAELQNVVYQAEDLVDEIATIAAVQHQREADGETSTNTNRLMVDEDMESRMEHIIERLDYYAKRKEALGLKQDVAGEKFHMSNRQPTSSLEDETHVYGRDVEKEKIIKLLSEETGGDGICVIPIVGMGGIGKTTLAQFAYNHGKDSGHFQKTAWVTVSDKFDVLNITKEIIEQLTSQPCQLSYFNQLHEHLKQLLTATKFLLVLDDIWSEDPADWETLQKPFKYGKSGSKVIVTTRSKVVASIMQSVPVLDMSKLSFEDTWSLFSRHAIADGDFSGHPDLEVIGKVIVRKCGGLPLAAKTLGGLLRSKPYVEEWDYFSKSEIWDLPGNILPALRLSYHFLPSHLKQCFTHCATFPKDYVFKKEKLVLLWMAHNFIPQQKSSVTLEEEGDRCFGELVSRSLLQKSHRDSSCFVMHDLIHDLAESILRSGAVKHPGCVTNKVRHFSCFSVDELQEINKYECFEYEK